MTFASLLRVGEFRALWIASAQSQIGDQLARVALSVLVFERTSSGLATSLTYALTYLPALIGGIGLASLADRLPRRRLLVGCDLSRAALYAAMALPGLPLLVLYLLLVVAVLIGAPFKAAEPAVIASLFGRPRYDTAIGLRTATSQTAQLVGFGLGGVAIAMIGPRPALAANAATFLVSAAIVRYGLNERPTASNDELRGLARITAGLRFVARSGRLRTLLGLSWLAGWWIVPEGLAVPYAAAHGGGAEAAGFLLMALPLGTVVGALALTRWLPSRLRPTLIGPLALATGLPLVACLVDPGVPVAFALWTVTGALGGYQVLVMTEFIDFVPDQMRGRAIGVAASGLLAAQGVGLVIGGVIASTWAVAPAIAVAGVAGAVLAVPLAITRLGGARRGMVVGGAMPDF